MYLQLFISKPEKDGNLRQLAKISLILSEEEESNFQKEGKGTLQCQTPLPINVFSHQNPNIKSPGEISLEGNFSWKGFFLPKSPKVGMKRPIPRKTAVRIPITKKEIILGWINPREVNHLLNWWEKSKNEFLEFENKSKNPSTTPTKQVFLPSKPSENKNFGTHSEGQKVSKRRGIQLIN